MNKRPDIDPMKDIYDNQPWTEMDLRDLAAALRYGDTIEDAAQATGVLRTCSRAAGSIGYCSGLVIAVLAGAVAAVRSAPRIHLPFPHLYI